MLAAVTLYCLKEVDQLNLDSSTMTFQIFLPHFKLYSHACRSERIGFAY
jgi:hypothetical protein